MLVEEYFKHFQLTHVSLFLTNYSISEILHLGSLE